MVKTLVKVQSQYFPSQQSVDRLYVLRSVERAGRRAQAAEILRCASVQCIYGSHRIWARSRSTCYCRCSLDHKMSSIPQSPSLPRIPLFHGGLKHPFVFFLFRLVSCFFLLCFSQRIQMLTGPQAPGWGGRRGRGADGRGLVPAPVPSLTRPRCRAPPRTG